MRGTASTSGEKLHRFGDADLLATPSRGRPLATVAIASLLGVAIGAAYLAFTPRAYPAATTIAIAQPGAATQPAAATGSFIRAQADVIRSSEVLRLADAAASLNTLETFRGVRDPVPALRAKLAVDVAPDGGIVTVSYAGARPDESAKIVNAVVDAYGRFVGQRRHDRAASLVAAAEAVRIPLAKATAEAHRALAATDAQTRGREVGEAARSRLRSATDAVTQQAAAAAEARRLYDAAVAEAGPQLSRLTDDQLDRALLPPGSADAPLRTPDRIAADLAAASTRLGELKRTYSDNHPSVGAARTQVERLRLESVVSTRQAWRAAAARSEELKKAADAAAKDVATVDAADAERARLAGEVARAESRLAAADQALDAAHAGAAYPGLDVEVVAAAEPEGDPTRPATPRPAPTLWLAALVGFAAGGMLAIAGEYRRAGTLRHVTYARGAADEATLARAAFGLRVLGSLPRTDIDATAADPAQAVSEGPAAEAADAISAALVSEGWTGGSLAVVPIGADSGGILAARAIAAALARTGRSTVLVEADEHTAVADGRPGFGEALAAGSLAVHARETRLPNLRMVAYGPARPDHATLLNSPRLSDAIESARAAFDAIVFDCPPLDAGDDGRLIAATVDGAVVVTPGDVTSLRKAAAARDVLGLAGATVVGAVLSHEGTTDRTVDAGGHLTNNGQGLRSGPRSGAVR